MYYADPDKLMRPWEPTEAFESDNKCTVRVWGREYEAGECGMLSSVISQNRQLLAAPMRIVAAEGGGDVVFSGAQCYLMNDVTEEAAAFCCAAESENFLIDTSCRVEYDGYMEWTLSVMPKGMSVAAACGVEAPRVVSAALTRLWLEIPLRTEHVPYFSFYPVNRYRADGQEIAADNLTRAGMVPGKLELPFCAQLYLSGEETGFAFLCESEENWAYDGYPIEIIRTEAETLMRIRLLDHEPEHWKNVPTDDRLHMLPVTFRFSLIATPVKPLPANPYEERGLHIDCGHKVLTDYEDYLFGRFVDTGEVTGIPAEDRRVVSDEITFDRIQRLGVKTLYLHEKWNTLQNSPYITRKSAQRLKKIVDEAHRRGIRVIPYFGYEISTLAPFWGEYGVKAGIRAVGDTSPQWTWYRQPPQRDLRVCYGDREFREFFVEGIRRLLETFRFDGIYLDGTVYPQACRNEAHGCGWRDADGKLHPTYPFAGIRQTMKALYAVMDPMGCTINCHGGMVFNLAAVSFYHSIWDGECIQVPFLNGLIHELPDGYMRAALNFRSIGLPFYMLCYANAPKWTARRAIALSLLYGVTPKPNNAGAPLEDASTLWKILDFIPMERAAWHPFYENTDAVSVSCGAVKVSYYQYSDVMGRTCRVAVCSNTRDVPVEAVVRFRDKPIAFRQLFGPEVRCGDDGVHVSFDNFDCAIFYLESEAESAGHA